MEKKVKTDLIFWLAIERGGTEMESDFCFVFFYIFFIHSANIFIFVSVSVACVVGRKKKMFTVPAAKEVKEKKIIIK